jgi:hypothetical protein
MSIGRGNRQRFFTGRRIALLFAVGGLLLFLLWLIAVVRGWNFATKQSFENVPAILAQAPCVGGVCVGTEGRDHVVASLVRANLVESVYDPGVGLVHYRVKDGGHGVIRFEANSQVVESVEFGWESSEFALGTVLESLGEPEELVLIFGCGRGIHIKANLFYPERGIEVVVQHQASRDETSNRGRGTTLGPNTPVSGVAYFDARRYDDRLLQLLDEVKLSGYFSIPADLTAETMVSAVQAWPGLGEPIDSLDICPR